MTTFFVFAILGLGAGVAYLLLAFGVVVLYKGSGVLNFAHGAIAMFAAYLYSDLALSGPGQAGMPKYLAAVIVMIGAAIFGVLFYFLVIKRLRFAPVLAKVVATLGLLAALQGIATIAWGAVSTTSPPSLFPIQGVKIFGGAYVGADRLYGFGLAMLMTFGLWWLYSRTRFGLATRAVSENEKGAALLGFSPDFVAALNWALGCALAALAGIVIAPVAGLDTATLPLMILPAFAAALLGRFRSFSLAALVAIGIGIAQSELTTYWGTQPGVTTALPLVVVIAAMIITGRLIPQRGALSEGRPPKTLSGRMPLVPTAIAIGGTVALLVFGNATYQDGVGVSIGFAIAALSLVVITGYIGQISIAQMTFAGVSGLLLSKLAGNLGVPFPLSLLLAALLTVPIGVLVGLPALRVRGINLAVVTFGLGYAVTAVVFQNPAWTGASLQAGNAPVPPPAVGGFSFNAFGHSVRFGLFALAILILVTIMVSNLRRSSSGRAMLAVRSNERAAAAAGIAVSRTKLQAFAFSSFIAGLGGAVLATQLNEANFTSQFTAGGSISLITVVYIGGIACVSGGLLAGLIATGGVAYLLLANIPGYENWFFAISGIALMITVLIQPDGAVPLIHARNAENYARLKQLLRPPRASREASDVPDAAPG